MIALLFRPRLARALWKLFKALNDASELSFDRRSLEVLADHDEKLSKLACEFWHIEYEPSGDPDPPLPPDLCDFEWWDGVHQPA
jgi:hypothetical protein